jgi:hypothetical protein
MTMATAIHCSRNPFMERSQPLIKPGCLQAQVTSYSPHFSSTLLITIPDMPATLPNEISLDLHCLITPHYGHSGHIILQPHDTETPDRRRRLLTPDTWRRGFLFSLQEHPDTSKAETYVPGTLRVPGDHDNRYSSSHDNVSLGRYARLPEPTLRKLEEKYRDSNVRAELNSYALSQATIDTRWNAYEIPHAGPPSAMSTLERPPRSLGVPTREETAGLSVGVNGDAPSAASGVTRPWDDNHEFPLVKVRLDFSRRE